MHTEFQVALSDFDLYNEAKGRRARTRQWYQRQLEQFGAFLAERQVEPARISGRDVLAFLAAERRRGLSDGSVDACFRALRAFFRWIERNGYWNGLANPVAADYRPKRKKRMGKRIDREQYKTLLASIGGESWIDARDRALVAVLFRVGLRRGEVAAMRRSHIDFGRRRLFIPGDTSKSVDDALVPFNNETKLLLLEYLFNRPLHPTDADLLWLSDDGAGGVRAAPLTGDGIYIMLRRRCQRAGLERFGPQSFRRGFGSALLNSGAAMSTVSALLRHSSVTVTETAYAEWELDTLQQEYDEVQKRMK